MTAYELIDKLHRINASIARYEEFLVRLRAEKEAIEGQISLFRLNAGFAERELARRKLPKLRLLGPRPEDDASLDREIWEQFEKARLSRPAS